MNYIVNKVIPRTIQVPSEAFKPRAAISKRECDLPSDDMEIDENDNFNATKGRTLASFYPSSIRASKNLDKHLPHSGGLVKIDNLINKKESDEEKLAKFKNK